MMALQRMLLRAATTLEQCTRALLALMKYMAFASYPGVRRAIANLRQVSHEADSAAFYRSYDIALK